MEKQVFIDFAYVKQHADFAAVLKRYRLTARQSGNQLVVRCPFHDDTTPSLKVTPERKSFHCFGCHAKGDILVFVQYMENCDLRGAAIKLAEICGIPLPTPRSERAPKRPRRVERAVEMAGEVPTPVETAPETSEEEEPLHELPTGAGDDVADTEVINPPLRFALKLDPTHPYLTARGLSDGTIEEFGLGYCTRGVMAGRIAIPIHDAEGTLVAYAGRWPGDTGWPEGEEKYKFPAGFRKSGVLFNLQRMARANHLVIVEGYWSVFKLQELGIPAVALMGSSISLEQVALLTVSGVKFITVLLDGDAPGRSASEQVVTTLSHMFFVRNVTLPCDAQPDEMDPAALDDYLAL